jgi:ferrochelatase
MKGETKGVILMNLGGPDSLNAVQPFLYNLFSDREIIRLGPDFLQKPLARIISESRARKARDYYRQIGGASPFLNITKAQANALEEQLGKRRKRFKAYVGMRYWHPFISDTVEGIVADGASHVVALPLFPQYSRATTGSCFNELKRVVAANHREISISYVQSYHDHPSYIKALAETIDEGFGLFSDDDRCDIAVLFSAHALPQKFMDEGDPYVEQIKSTISAVTDKAGLASWSLSFQSRSGPVKWIGPETKEMIKSLAGQDVKNLLIVPISFVSDHVETLYEMDILYKKLGRDLGMRVERAPSLNTSPAFIDALADITI